MRLSTYGGEPVVVSLRQPQAVDALKLDPKSLSAAVEFRIDQFPDKESVQLEILPVDEGDSDAQLDLDRPIVTSTEAGRLLLKNRESNPKMWVEFQANIGAKTRIEAYIVFQSQAGWGRVRNAGQMNQLVKMVENARLLAQRQVDLAPRDEDAQTALNQAENELKLLRQYLDSLNQLIAQPIQFRMVSSFRGSQAVLVQAEVQVDPEPNVAEVVDN